MSWPQTDRRPLGWIRMETAWIKNGMSLKFVCMWWHTGKYFWQYSVILGFTRRSLLDISISVVEEVFCLWLQYSLHFQPVWANSCTSQNVKASEHILRVYIILSNKPFLNINRLHFSSVPFQSLETLMELRPNVFF